MHSTTPPSETWPASAPPLDLLDAWTELETRLSLLLRAPTRSENFGAELRALERRMETLLRHDSDGSLYLLLQLAASTSVGYSASHALVCASLCHLLAPALELEPVQQRCLNLAALSMNIAMTTLQDDLAAQAAPPTAEQRAQIDRHPLDSSALLQDLGVDDLMWLELVARHHDTPPPLDAASSVTEKLTRALMATDRYAALISPRETRPGRVITDSGRSVVARQGDSPDPVGHALLRTVGICPPGTFVRLQDQSVAVVLRRTGRPGAPLVAPVLDAQGDPVPEPVLVNTDEGNHRVEAALVTRSVRVRLNHNRMLQLAASA